MERFFIYAKPSVRDTTKYTLVVYPSTNSLSSINELNINLLGKYFFDIKNIYVSAANSNMFDNVTFFNPFSTITNLYSANPGFLAAVVPQFTLHTDQLLSFYLPHIPKIPGFFDIIVENEAGYGKLTTGSIRNYVSSWSGFINVSLPSISGIKVEVAL
jgi:hypothetical protein